MEGDGEKERAEPVCLHGRRVLTVFSVNGMFVSLMRISKPRTLTAYHPRSLAHRDFELYPACQHETAN